RPEAIALVELELQGLLPERFPRDPDEAHDLLVRLGDLSPDEASARGVSVDWLRALEKERRAVSIRVAGERRWIAAEDAGRYREAMGASLPIGLPEWFLDAGVDPLASLLRRFARTHVPFVTADPAKRWALSTPAVEAALTRLAARGDVLAGEFRKAADGREYCHPEVLRILRRRSLAALRREVESVAPDALARFLPAWHGIGVRGGGVDQLLEVVFQLQGLALPASVIERDVIAARVGDYAPRLLDELVSMGEVVWVGRGSLGATDGRVALYLRGDAPRLVPPPVEPPQSDLHERIRLHLGARGASFFRDIYSACSATACSPVRQSSAKDGQAGSPVSIPCCARWRSRGGSAAATSSKVLVARSSRCQERSIDCAPCASRAAGSSRSRRRIPPTRMARCCPGRIRMDGWRGRQAPIASLKMDGLSFTSSVAGARC